MNYRLLVCLKNRVLLTKIKIKYLRKLLLRIVLKHKKIKKYPTTIQLPITYKCNFNCVMCGMQNLVSKTDYSVEDLENILSDRLFKEVVSVGLNGGEPFLRPDLVECVDVILKKLPKLRTINIISNGYFTNSIIEKLSNIKMICENNGVVVNLSLSVDGVGEMQDFMRGHKNSWKNVIETISQIKADESNYCDSLAVICTVTRHNVYKLEEVEAWSKSNNITVIYNIATINARIDNFSRFEDFSIFFDEKARLIAQEFFYKKAIQEQSETYFALFLYIKEKVRYSLCPCQYNEWVTLVPNGNISYCATFSRELGNALLESAYDIFNTNVFVLDNIRTTKCSTCSHYIGSLDSKGLKIFYDELIKNNKIIY